MALVRWNPREAFNLSREIDKMVNHFNGNLENSTSQGWQPRVDVEETDDHFTFYAELPGMERDDIKVQMHEGILTLEGEKKAGFEQKEGHFYRTERRYGLFKRSFRLGTEVDAEKIQASYKDGVLTLTVPKVEAAKPRQIEVTVS